MMAMDGAVLGDAIVDQMKADDPDMFLDPQGNPLPDAEADTRAKMKSLANAIVAHIAANATIGELPVDTTGDNLGDSNTLTDTGKIS